MIRKAQANDIFSIEQIEKQVLNHTLGLNFLLNEIENVEISHYFVYEINKEIVGYIGSRIYDDVLEIFNFVVKSNYQSQGIGQSLFDHLVEYSKTYDVKSITLEVRKSNKQAIRFYLKNDFYKSHIRKNYYENEDAIVLIREVE